MSANGSPDQGGPTARTPPAALPQNPTTPPQGPATGGPAPLPPQPEPPRISAAELALLTEAAATKNGTFQCTLCNKQFGYKNGLIRHVRLTHVGEKPYQCNICNRRFGYKHILMEHQNLHYGNRPYACNMCDKKFAARSNLIQHRMVHKRPFNCNLCNKRFDREDQLKKHLFAHPQSLLTCSICKYTATSQKDLNKHMMETHQPAPGPPEGSPGSASGDHMQPGSEHGGPTSDRINHYPTHTNGMGGGPSEMARTEPITPPDSSEEQPPTMTPPGGGRMPPQGPLLPSMMPSLAALDPRGYRIDSICSQLGSHFPPASLPQKMYHGVIVKKEVMEEDFSNAPPISQAGPMYAMPLQHQDNRMDDQPPQLSPRSELGDNHGDPSSLNAPGLPMQGPQPPYSSPDSYRNSATPQQSPHGSSYHSPSSQQHTPDYLGASKGRQSSAALPSIHEVFSRRGPPSGSTPPTSKLPPFAPNFGMPLLTSESRMPMHHDLSMPLMSPPPTSNSSNLSLSGGRPTAQLPPITQVLLRQSRDKAVQSCAPIPGFPSLEDVISYYMSQGRLFKCQHCHILFYERGMYFLHASLHGPSSPWECSICHKVCSDKNEFTLHFVNQQHNC